jgi:hypothetical protein
MKRILLLSVLVIFIASMSFGQMAYNKGDQVVSLGLGLGGLAGGYGSSGVAITGGYEYGIHENISLGGIVSYASSSDLVVTITNIVIGARGAYHIDLLHKDNIDTYGGLMLGYNIVSSNLPAGWGWTYPSYMFFGLFAGGRYYFNPNLAVQAELGWGLGFLNVGIAYKF